MGNRCHWKKTVRGYGIRTKDEEARERRDRGFLFQCCCWCFPASHLGRRVPWEVKEGERREISDAEMLPSFSSPQSNHRPFPSSAAASICLPTPGGGRGKGALDVGRKRPIFFPHKLKTDPLLLSGTWFLPLVTTKHDFQKVFPLFRRRIYLAGHSAGSHLCAMVLSSPWFSALEVNSPAVCNSVRTVYFAAF